MKIAKHIGNKQHQTHTNTLETKTIRTKDTVPGAARTAGAIALVAGFLLIVYSVPALMYGSLAPVDEPPELTTLTPAVASPQPAASLKPDNHDPDDAAVTPPANNEKPDEPQQTNQSRASLHIEMTTNTEGTASGEAVQPSLTVNGQPVDLPENGRVKQDLEDEHSSTRIRGRIDAGSGANITISTDSKMNMEAD